MLCLFYLSMTFSHDIFRDGRPLRLLEHYLFALQEFCIAVVFAKFDFGGEGSVSVHASRL